MQNKMKLTAAILSLLCLSSSIYRKPSVEIVEIVPIVQTIYKSATIGTDIQPDLFRALAMVESAEDDSAIGDGGFSRGRFQINEQYRDERVRLYGDYDPHDPVQSARVAALILQAHYDHFGNWPLALTAYNAGATYAKQNGRRMAYINHIQLALGSMGSRIVVTACLRGIVE